MDGFYRLWGVLLHNSDISELVWKHGFVLQADEGGKTRKSINYMSVSGLEVGLK